MSAQTWRKVAVIAAVFGAVYLIYSYRGLRVKRETHGRLTHVLESTDKDPQARIDSLESFLLLHEDPRAASTAYRALLGAHRELGSDSVALKNVSDRFLAADSSSTTHYAVAQLYSARNVYLSEALIHARHALDGLNSSSIPKNMSEEDWQRMKGDISGQMNHMIGNIFVETGQPDSAVAVLEALVENSPDRPAYLTVLSRALAMSGNTSRAIEGYLRVVALKPDDVAARTDLEALFIPDRGDLESLEQQITRQRGTERARRRTKFQEMLIDQEVEPFEIADSSGEITSSTEFLGKVVVLDFWAAWAGPCLHDLTLFQQAQSQLSRRNDIAMLAINVDQDTSQARAFLRENGLTLPIYYKGETTTTDYHVSGVPMRVIIGPEGRMRFKQVGFDGVGDYVEELTWQVDLASR